MNVKHDVLMGLSADAVAISLIVHLAADALSEPLTDEIRKPLCQRLIKHSESLRRMGSTLALVARLRDSADLGDVLQWADLVLMAEQAAPAEHQFSAAEVSIAQAIRTAVKQVEN